MSAQKASAPVRLVRLVVAAILVVLAAAVILHLLRERGGPRPEAVKPLPDDRVVDSRKRSGTRNTGTASSGLDVRGANFFLGPDGRNHLKGSVEITDHGAAGEVVSRITADEVVYDTDRGPFRHHGPGPYRSGGRRPRRRVVRLRQGQRPFPDGVRRRFFFEKNERNGRGDFLRGRRGRGPSRGRIPRGNRGGWRGRSEDRPLRRFFPLPTARTARPGGWPGGNYGRPMAGDRADPDI